MSGDATFAGTTYQARVIAFIYVHILAQMPLGWLGTAADIPLAVSGEVKGPGDDAGIEFGQGHPPVEVQAKHGLTGGSKLDEVIERIQTVGRSSNSIPVVLTLSRSSSRTILQRFRSDLERLRSGRVDGLGEDARRLIDASGLGRATLERLYVVPIDLDHSHDPEAKFAIQLLQQVLTDPANAVAAWAVLANDADDICARKLRRTRKDLAERLASAGIAINPPLKQAHLHRQLDFTRRLLEQEHSSAAIALLAELEPAILAADPEPTVRYRLFQQRAAALLQQHRPQEALTYAQRALDIDPQGLHAMVSATVASLLSGDATGATARAERLVQQHGEEPMAWTTFSHVAAAIGQAPPSPPESVAQSPYYRISLADIAADAGEWQQVLDLTAGLLAEGVTNSTILRLRIRALINVDYMSTPSLNEDRYREAERLASELIDSLPDETHPHVVQGLVLRSTARRALGRDAEAGDDLARARELATDDPDAIGYAARARVLAEDPKGALEILRHPVVDKFPLLLALRAQVLAILGDHAAARKDLDCALARAADAQDPNMVRFSLADAALYLPDPELASRVLDSVPPERHNHALYILGRARTEFARGNHDAAEPLFKDAASRDQADAPLILAELAARFLRCEKWADALRIHTLVGEDAILEHAPRDYTFALFKNNELGRARAVLDKLAASGPLPKWALQLSTEIALRQEDVAGAVDHLLSLVAQGDATIPTRLELATQLVGVGRLPEAAPQVAQLATEKDLTPRQRMQTAQLLLALDRHEDSVAMAFQAFRAASGDPGIHRAFITLMLRSNRPPAEVSEVAANTYVHLSHGSETREYTIYSDQPIDPVRHEIDVAQAQALGLIGKKVGDTIVEYQGTFRERAWTIDRLLSAVHHAVQDAMMNFEERFPTEQFFLTRFTITDGPSVAQFAPIIASVEGRRRDALGAFAQYRERVLPLGILATLLGVSIPELIASAAAEDALGVVWVEWQDVNGQERSRQAAIDAKTVVLARSAMHSIFSLGIQDVLASRYKLLAPQSLRDELVKEVKEASERVTRGHGVVHSGRTGLSVHTQDPGDPQLVADRDQLSAQLSWLEASTRIEPRPLESIAPSGSREEEARSSIGPSSFDAVKLSEHQGATLFADDLGLRRFVVPERSFSTVALLPALAILGALSVEERDNCTLKLIQARYAVIPPSRELLQMAVISTSGVPRPLVENIFGLLGGTAMGLESVAQIAAQVLKFSVIQPIERLSPGTIAKLCLAGMATRWPGLLCAAALERAVREELLLLPGPLRIVEEVCSEFRRSSLLVNEGT